MAWIESHQTLRDHPKKDHLVELLFNGNADDTADLFVIGLLHRLWWWALDYAPDGDVSKYTPMQIAKGCGWRGDPVTLCDGLREAGWIDEDDSLHDWYDYAGKLVQRREADRLRKSAARLSDAERKAARRGRKKADPEPEGKDRFDDFYAAYPRKVEKQKALKAWRARVNDGADQDVMVRAAGNYAEFCRRERTEPRFIKHPSTFIGPDSPYLDFASGVPAGSGRPGMESAPRQPSSEELQPDCCLCGGKVTAEEMETARYTSRGWVHEGCAAERKTA